MGQEKGADSPTGQSRGTAALTPLPGQTVRGQALHGGRAFLCRGGGTTQLGLHAIIEEKPPGVDRQGADQKGETDNGD